MQMRRIIVMKLQHRYCSMHQSIKMMNRAVFTASKAGARTFSSSMVTVSTGKPIAILLE